MPRVSSDTTKRLQKEPSCIRNICILAHVDHGKTSLSDSLLASNGIVSQRLAGKVRYLDARPDEQLRGITMESSAISLYFRVLHKQEGRDEPLVDEHLINLIDSPGHIDFSSEVSAASKLCDGAVVLVDVVEGVCSQTVTVLRQCWTEKLKPVLVLNKIDRLITELQLTPQEAYKHLSKIIENVNSVIGSFFAGDRLLDDLSWREQLENNANAEFVDKDDTDLYFEPSKNNVIFASAIDGWGFNVGTFAKIFEQKLGAKRENLQKVLWGDYYIDPKTKKFINNKGLKGRALKPLFVSLVLENIWKIYEYVFTTHDAQMLEKITSSLNIKVSPRDLRSKDYKNLLKTIMGQWLPVSTAVLYTVVSLLPSPLESQKVRLEAILGESQDTQNIDTALISAIENCDSEGPVCAYVSKMLSIPNEELPTDNSGLVSNEFMERTQRARKEALKAAKAAELAESFSKMGVVDKDDLYTRSIDTTVTPEIEEEGLKRKMKSKFAKGASNNHFNADLTTAAATEDPQYEEEEEENVPHALADFVPEDIDPNDPMAAMFEYEEEDPFKNKYEEGDQEDEGEEQEQEQEQEQNDETIIGFARLYSGTLRVGQEIAVLGPKYNPVKPNEHVQKTTIRALYLFMGKELVSLDVCPSGNIVGIGGLAGKVLKNGTLLASDTRGVNLATVNVNHTPIVRVALEPVRPTEMDKLVNGLRLLNQADPCVETYVEETGEHILCTAGELHLERCLKDLRERFAGIEISSSSPVIPYKETILKTSNMNPPSNPTLGRGVTEVTLGSWSLKFRCVPLPSDVTQFLIDHHVTIQALVGEKTMKDDPAVDTTKFIERLQQGFGADPDSAELKDMVKNICAFGPKRTGPNILFAKHGLLQTLTSISAEGGSFEFEDSIRNGFQLAVNSGPLANEPVQGVAVILEDITHLSADDLQSSDIPNHQTEVFDFSGRLIITTRDAIHHSFLDWSPRLMWAMYSSEIQSSAEVLGKVYAVVQQRSGRIISEELKEGTPFFQIIARIPVIEAFGFSEDIRKKSSGAAQPQLVFSGFECIDMDPFWVPTTIDELEELGDTADRENIARRHMNNIRRRKGLFIEEKVVAKAEKQRTLKRN
ncbi:HBR498Wp [Eremothecium sinecaudum]|uniref:Elongation factor 2 n=1 Tax=Eremothecium sinecaudum TaxID=45286 RepID=A0A120K1H4_9SACH|nr:HBR498Wp [Eremothecium sinecaudum]AMD19399.1 HBR498Wp [Eremothecium sinecaudum]